jgi:hypothetical protein
LHQFAPGSMRLPNGASRTPELRADSSPTRTRAATCSARARRGSRPRQEAVRVAFGRLMRSIGLEGVTHHVLRHTGASAMVAGRHFAARRAGHRRLPGGASEARLNPHDNHPRLA